MASYYISPTGNDSTGNGTSGTPWATVSKAVTSSTVGDTIYCQDGTYSWGNQSFSSSRTVQAVNTYKAIFDGGGGSPQWSNSGAGNTLQITGIIFQNVSGQKFFVSGSGSPSTISWTLCIWKTFTASTGSYRIVDGANGNSPTYTWTNCIINDPHSVASHTAYLCLMAAGAINMTGCVIYLPTSGATGLTDIFNNDSGSLTITLKNNVFYGNGGQNFKGGPGVTVVTDHNDFYAVTNQGGTGSITSNPIFVDPANSEFHLRSNDSTTISPALGTGTPV